MKPIEYYQAHGDTFLNELKAMSKIPSVSFPAHDPKYVEDCARYVADMFKRFGFLRSQVVKYKDAHPYVIAYVGEDPNKATYLLYAHHDVQPVGDESKWQSPPFEPTLRSGRLYGRGTADDKAGVIIHLAAIASYLKTNTPLPINLVILIEGEEEIGSEHLSGFLKDQGNLFPKIAGMILTDSSNFDTGIPSLTISLRGLVAADVELRTLKQSLHSGMWGGSLPDPVMALSKLLSYLMDDEGRIAIPGIYDKVKKPSDTAARMLQELPMNESIFRKQTGLLPTATLLQTNIPLLEAMWYQPSLAINAIQASSREKSGNIICDSAWAKVGIRLAPDQDPQETFQQFKSFLSKHTPWGCELTITPDSMAKPWSTDIRHPAFAAALEALSQGYGSPAKLIGSGGSIPFVETISNAFGQIPALLIGVEDPYTNAHSENESLNLKDFDATIKSEIYLFEKLAHLKH